VSVSVGVWGGEVLVVDTAVQLGADARTSPRLGPVLLTGEVRDVEVRDRLVPVTDGGPAGWRWAVKRAMDVTIVVALVLLVLPVLVVAAVGVRVSSPGPVLFRQTRVGRHGRQFTMFKFRTFPVDHVDRVVSLDVDACPLWWGRVLRRTSIDELPQLFNVIRGDMSLVGPRPERPRFAVPLAETIPGYRERHRAPVGLTGFAQVKGLVGTTSIEERVAADNAYIDDWSIRRDLVILAKTVPTLVRKCLA
jgi:lipopolysaccharide/colanic/teichoic acid biosynthesis glycosyltransferase